MRGVGKRSDGLSGRRKNAREPVVLAGSAIAPGSSRSVVVSDVSPMGAKLQGRELPKAGADILLTVGEVELFATVAWATFDECGVTFEEPLAKDTIAQLKHEGCWAKVMGVKAA